MDVKLATPLDLLEARVKALEVQVETLQRFTGWLPKTEWKVDAEPG